MYWLIENDEQLNVLVNSGYDEVFIEVIPHSYNVHPANNGISLVYIRPLLANKGFVIGIDHSETLNVKLADLNEWLKSLKTLYCRDKKEILHYFPIKTLYDINSTAPTYIPSKTKTSLPPLFCSTKIALLKGRSRYSNCLRSGCWTLMNE